MRLKIKIFIMMLIALLATSGGNAFARRHRVYDPDVPTRTVTAEHRTGHSIEKRHMSKDQMGEKQAESTPSLTERIEAILHPAAPVPDKTNVKPVERAKEPEDSIEGLPMATQKQCLAYLLRHNPQPKISVTPERLVAIYYEEAGREGIKPDLAFAQAIKETGFFGYGGTVTPDQNNYCGLGTTSYSVKGGYFPTAEIGVRAHIQHLMAYCTTRLPEAVIVDPRYWLVRESYDDMLLTRWTELNGRWAVPGPDYGESILGILSKILLEK